MPIILITGAGGKTGMAVIAALTRRGERVRAFVRDERRAAAAAALGVHAIVGDLADADALTRAAEGARAIYHIGPNVSANEVAFARSAVTAAIHGGIEHVVYHSVLHPQIEAMPHHWDKLRVEELLLASGLAVTFLRPTAYMQNILAGWPAIRDAGLYRIPYPVTTRISLVDLDDVAEAAALVLTTGGHSGAAYDLVGTPALSQDEVAAEFGHALGRPVRAEAESVETWEARARASGLGEHQRETLTKMFGYYAKHGLAGSPQVLHWLLGRPPGTLAAFARRAAAGSAGHTDERPAQGNETG
jgi:NAD(P)H dehydrogenase (quinone)